MENNSGQNSHDTFKLVLNYFAALILTLCVIAALFIACLFGMKQAFSPIQDINVSYEFRVDTLGAITPTSRAYADSVLYEVSKHEQRISDKYEYLIEQRSNVQDYLTWGSVLVTLIISIVGFFGYKSLHDIEERLITRIEPSASKAAIERAESICNTFEMKAASNVKTLQMETESSLKIFKDETFHKLLQDVNNSVSLKTSKQKSDLRKMAEEAAKTAYGRILEDRVQMVADNSVRIDDLQNEIALLKTRMENVETGRKRNTSNTATNTKEKFSSVRRRSENTDPFNI